MSDMISQWQLIRGPCPMLAGRIKTYLCAPHLHDTFTIAILRRGTAVARMHGAACLWRAGEVFLGNPYVIHAGGNDDEAIEYDVYYPPVDLLAEAAGCRPRGEYQPKFATTVLSDPTLLQEITEALAELPQGAGSSSIPVEERVHRFFRSHPRLLILDRAEELAPVRLACGILRDSVESSIDWTDLPLLVGCSRWHFIRLFRKTTGVVPSAYFRHLRLARALRLICSGSPIADAAAATGFADQAHLTREFKRTFGRTPGKIARDIIVSNDRRPDAIGTAARARLDPKSLQ